VIQATLFDFSVKGTRADIYHVVACNLARIKAFRLGVLFVHQTKKSAAKVRI